MKIQSVKYDITPEVRSVSHQSPATSAIIQEPVK